MSTTEEFSNNTTKWIPTINGCMFCTNPEGAVYLYDIVHLFGYYSCPKCKDTLTDTANNWLIDTGFDKIRSIYEHTSIKIKRTNGEIQDGWSIDKNRLVMGRISFHNDKICVPCKNNQIFTQRYCFIDEIISLNEKLFQ